MMGFRATEDSALRALRALAREAADEPTPPIDWDGVEERLFAEMAQGERPSLIEVARPDGPRAESAPSRVGSPWTAALAAAAVVALVATGGFDTKTQSPAADKARATTVNGVTLEGSLELGDVVASHGRSLVYEMPGVVTFTLAPGSRIQLVAASRNEDRHGTATIALAEGSVHAEVEPRSDGEAFAIEVGLTRVAVHGTSFTVTREGDRAIVEVAHGSVAVGPAGHPGSTQGWLLVGPDQGSFSLDGARDAEWLALPASSFAPGRTAGEPTRGSAARSSEAEAERAARQTVSGPTSTKGGHARAAAGHTKDDIAPAESVQALAPKNAVELDAEGTAAILRAVEACYERQIGSFDVSFSIRSSLSLSVQPNGAIHEGVFNPPLSPTLMDCARDAIMSVRFAPGETARQVHMPVNLSRSP
jgi:ferric-dicitrate binding protein FerR (iron transport regulator)